jgi:hypothetical protein
MPRRSKVARLYLRQRRQRTADRRGNRSKIGHDVTSCRKSI